MRDAGRPAASGSVLALCLSVVLSTCGSPVLPSTPPLVRHESTATTVPVPASELRIAVPEMPFLSGRDFDTVVGRMIHSGLYRYDQTLAPVPDLATCDTQDGAVEIHCQLSDAMFHDGTPVTVSDVVFAFQMASGSTCFVWVCPAFTPFTVEPDADRGVTFTLERPDATFMTTLMVMVSIEPEARIRASYRRFREAIDSGEVATLGRTRDELTAVFDESDPDCQPHLAAAEALLGDIGVRPWAREEFTSAPDGRADPCGALAWQLDRMTDAIESLAPGLTEVESIARAYPLLDIGRDPVGAGPWRFESYDAVQGRLTLLADRSYHGGPARTERVVVTRSQDEARIQGLLREHALDWWAAPSYRRDVDWAAGVDGLTILRHPSFGYDMLGYNVRPGRLFADGRLRAAMEFCIDKEDAVDAATSGRATPVYSPVPPASWAFRDLAGAGDDVVVGKRLIEESGWTLGDDGIYIKGDRRLSFEMLVRDDARGGNAFLNAVRLKFVEIARWMVRRCGIELVPRRVGLEEQVTLMRGQGLPGTEVIDASLWGWVMGPDPYDDIWHSRNMPERQDPDADAHDWMGFENADVDELVDQGLAVYDRSERGRIYRALQQALARERPVMFLYSYQEREIISARLHAEGTTLATSSPAWWWKLEDLVVDR